MDVAVVGLAVTVLAAVFLIVGLARRGARVGRPASDAADAARRRCELRAELRRLVPDTNSAESLLRAVAQQESVAVSSPAAFERAIERARAAR